MPDMHAAVAARSTMQHRHKRVGELEERALINLPFPIPSTPLLDPILKPLAPLLTPIIDGTHPETKTTSTTPTAHTTSTTPTQAPAPTANPTTPASSPTSPSTGNPPAGGGSNSPGNGGSSAPGNSGSSGSGGSANNGSGSSDGSSGGGSGGSSGSTTPGGSANNAGGASNPSASTVGGVPAASGTGVTVPGTLVSDPSSFGTGSEGSSGSDASGGGSAGSAVATNLSGVVNANGAFVSGTSVALAPGETANVGGSTGITTSANAAASDRGKTAGANSGSPTGSDSGSMTGTTHADPSNPSAMSDASVHHGLSTGIIVAICVILGVLALLFLAFCCRRRAVAKRLRRRRTWFTAGAYGAGNNEEYKDGPRSARSSFATHYDRGDVLTPAPQIDLSVTSGEMSQVWPSNMSGSITLPSASRMVESMPSPTIRAAPDRSSFSSMSSGGSRPPSQTSQYLAAPDAAATQGSPFGADFPSPFSVRPFSPSETFSFPRPPQDDARSRASGMMSGSVVSGSIVSGSIHSAAFYTAEEHHQSPEQGYASMHASVHDHEAPAEPAENPFLDFTEVRPASPSPSASASVELSAESAPSSVHFAPTETIRRPFVPTMDDEMAVAPEQEVRILRRFDDGWAYAETLATGRRGLIPIDTLREVEEDLPAFLAKKRLSSYAARASHRASQRVSAFSGVSVGKAM